MKRNSRRSRTGYWRKSTKLWYGINYRYGIVAQRRTIRTIRQTRHRLNPEVDLERQNTWLEWGRIVLLLGSWLVTYLGRNHGVGRWVDNIECNLGTHFRGKWTEKVTDRIEWKCLGFSRLGSQTWWGLW